MDRIFILHADHEQNASTSTVRLCGLVGRQPVRLHRRRHRVPVGPGARRRQRGRAEDARRRSATSRRSAEFIKQGEGQELGRALMGFGHRVYKNYDPRAKLMRETCHEVLEELGLHERSRCSSSRWRWRRSRSRTTTSSSRKLYPNVDFYSGIVQKALGIPVSMFTVHLRARAHRRLDRAVERDDLRPRVQDRPPAPALQRAARSAT